MIAGGMGNAPRATSPVPIGGIVDGKYRVERILGMGGMGCVVQATHVQLLAPVAIKFVLESDAGDPDVSARFLREARAASALSSEHVARVTDVGTLPSGTPFMVMDYLEGETLEDRLEKGTLSVDDIVQVLIQTCEALSEAHARGIVHRDIKPANLFLVARPTKSLFVKVLDFGISRVSDPRLAVREGLTGTAAIMGTPHFMAPEQMTSSKAADARADIWALGVTMYRALSGRYPFDAATLMELGSLVLSTDAPPLERVVPGIAPPLAAIVRRCLEREPARRYASAAELHAALIALPSMKAQPQPRATTVAPPMRTSATHAVALAAGPSPTAPTGRGGRSAGVWIAVLVCTIVIGAMGLAVLRRSRMREAARPLVPEPTTSIAAIADPPPPIVSAETATPPAASTAAPVVAIDSATAPPPARSTTAAHPGATKPPTRPPSGKSRTPAAATAAPDER
jgi:serine/threonine-protein kinase